MAAGSNWKRPWEDKVGEQTPPWYPPSTPSSTIPPPPPQQDGTSSSTSLDSRKLPPIPRNASPPLPPTSRKAALPFKSEPSMETTPRPVSPYSNSAKRPRLGYSYNPSSHATHVVSPNNEASLTGVALLQTVSSPLPDDGNKGPSAAPGGAVSDSDLVEYGPGHRLIEPVAVEEGNGGGEASQECEDCKQVRQVLRELVSGFLQLRAELLTSMPASLPYPFISNHSDFAVKLLGLTFFLPFLPQKPDESMAGVTRSLEWILNILQSKGMAHRGAMTRASQTHLHGNASQLHASSGPESPQIDGMKRRLDAEKERDDSLKRAQHSSMDESSRVSESTPSPSIRERRRRSFVSDVTTVQPQSSVSQSPSSGYFPSPMQAPLPNARAFSSSSSLGFGGNHMLPPISPPSQPPSQAALAAHLSDLQHQVGTKSLALQTLQSEHNYLLSAYQRSQLRCGALEKKFQVSDAEINNLTEERNRLQAQCEGFEKQVEDLLEQRDAANKLSIANGGQYTSILQQASRLESQSLSDRKKWRVEKEEWERQKEEMEQRIKQLEKEKEDVFAGSKKPHIPDDGSELFHKSRSPSTGGLPDHRTDILTLTVVPGDIILSANPDDLRHEIIRLRHKTNDLDRILQDLKTEGQRIDQMICGIGTISKRVVAKVEAVTTTTATPRDASTTEDSAHQ